MRVLLTNDIHNTRKWYSWLLSQAPRFDLIAIAGDLFDMYDERGVLPQILAFDEFSKKVVASGCALAFCSGNHDGAQERDADQCLKSLRSLMTNTVRVCQIVSKPFWADAFDAPLIIPDGRATILTFRSGERLLVSTHPFSFDCGIGNSVRSNELWEVASDLRTAENIPWLALHHEPVAGSKVGGAKGSTDAKRPVLRKMPTYIASGHLHGQPYAPSGSWRHRLPKTWCFNAGAAPSECSDIPNHIIIDTTDNTVAWHASSRGIAPSRNEVVSLI